MTPTLEEGDLVVLDHVQASQISVGDIIVYNPPCSDIGSSVIHRVVNATQAGFITKGDNNGETDQAGPYPIAGTVTFSCISGKVVFVIPYIEKLADLPYGANYLLAALIVILVFYSECSGKRDEGEGSETAKGQA